MSKYWNGYQWVTHAKPGVEVVFDVPTQEERAALVDAELRPRTTTEEEVPVPEQPTPNLVFGTYEEGIDDAITRGEKVDFTVTHFKNTRAEEPKDVVITDEVRARIRAELAKKPDGSSK